MAAVPVTYLADELAFNSPGRKPPNLSLGFGEKVFRVSSLLYTAVIYLLVMESTKGYQI